VQIHKHGGTVLPTFDPETTTHIVSETSQQMTLRALGLKSLAEIPQAIPTVKWAWVISGKQVPGERDRREMDYEFMHAAFPSRVDAGRSFTKGSGKQKAGDDVVYVWFFFRNVLCGAHLVTNESARAESSSSRSSSRSIGEEEPREDRHKEKRRGRDAEVRAAVSSLADGKQVAGSSRPKSDSPSNEDSPSSKKRKKLKVG
jgi:hypothetical protein